MKERRMHIDDKEKMYRAHRGLRSGLALSVLSLFKCGEEITTKELSERLKQINKGYRFEESSINKALTHELKEKVISCGKNKWKLKDWQESFL